jgi:adenine-specific DNA methylase
MELPIHAYLDSNKQYIIPFTPEEVPKEIPISYKLFTTYFPTFSKINYTKLKISNIGLYSIAKPFISERICKLILKCTSTSKITITDALSNVGGTTMMFASYFQNVNACEIVSLHCDILKNNLMVYNLYKKVTVLNNDYITIMKKIKQDVIFFDPPWGGKNYKNETSIRLGINNINITFIVNMLFTHAQYICIRVPYNYQFTYFIKNININAKLKFYRINPYAKKYAQVLIIVKCF